MITGEGVDAKVDEFAASAMELKSRNQIYSAMVVYGLLTFTQGKVYIPNRELMLKYEELLQIKGKLGESPKYTGKRIGNIMGKKILEL